MAEARRRRAQGRGRSSGSSRKTYDGLRHRAALRARRERAGPSPAARRRAPWQVMQRVDHPDPAAANDEALHDLENGATGLSLVFAGAVGAYGYRPAGDRGGARARTRRRLSRRRHRDRTRPVAARRQRHAATSLALVEARRCRSGRTSTFASASIRSARMARAAQAPLPWQRDRAGLRRLIGGLSAPRLSAGRSPSPTAASSTRPAARKRRSLPSCSRSRSPICARWKRAASRSMRRGACCSSGSPPTPISSSPPRNSARCANCGHASRRPAASRRSRPSSRPRPPGA